MYLCTHTKGAHTHIHKLAAKETHTHRMRRSKERALVDAHCWRGLNCKRSPRRSTSGTRPMAELLVSTLFHHVNQSTMFLHVQWEICTIERIAYEFRKMFYSQAAVRIVPLRPWFKMVIYGYTIENSLVVWGFTRNHFANG